MLICLRDSNNFLADNSMHVDAGATPCRMGLYLRILFGAILAGNHAMCYSLGHRLLGILIAGYCHVVLFGYSERCFCIALV